MTPITPHICEELWHKLGHSEPITSTRWPEVDESARVKSTITIAVQVNGKLRASIQVPPGSNQEVVQATAMNEINVQRHIDGKPIRKVILVPDRLLSIVVA